MVLDDTLPQYFPQLIGGAAVTLRIVSSSALIGALLALPLTLAAISRNSNARRAAAAYMTFFRGTPLLTQLFLVYYGSGQFRAELASVGLWQFFRDPTLCTILTFSLNTAAYQAQIYRGALGVVPQGQVEAAKVLGLSRIDILTRVLTPQALIIALRPLGNELILLVKASAVASVVAVYDLLGVARLIFTRSFDLAPYAWAAVIYIVFVEVFRRLWDRLDKRARRHLIVAD